MGLVVLKCNWCGAGYMGWVTAIMLSWIPVFSAFATITIIDLLVDKTLYKEDVFSFSAQHEFTASYFKEANKYHATLNKMLELLIGITVGANHTLYNVSIRTPLFDCIAHVNYI